MAINPITTDKLRTIVLIGHSNADGWAPSESVMSTNTTLKHLLPATGNPLAEPENAWWKNVYVATWEQAFPGADGVPLYSAPSNCDLLELTIANPLTPGDTAHPHP